MPTMPKTPKRQRIRTGPAAELPDVSELRKRSVRALTRDYAHVFADPVLHKRILNFLFSCYVAVPVREQEIALEFWNAYRHMVEGKSVLDFEFLLLDREMVVLQLRRILRGDPVSLDMEGKPDHERSARESEDET